MKGGEYHLNGNISLAAPPVPVLEPDRGPVSARTPRFPSQVSHSGQRAQGTCSLLVSPFCWSQHLSPRFCWGFSQRSAPPWPPWPPWLGLQPAQVPLLGPQVQCRPCNDSACPSPPPNVSYIRGAHRGPWRLPESWKGQRGGLGEGRTVGQENRGSGGPWVPLLCPQASASWLFRPPAGPGVAQEEVPLVLPPPAELSVLGPLGAHSRAAAPVAVARGRGHGPSYSRVRPSVPIRLCFCSSESSEGTATVGRPGLGQKKALICLPTLGVPQNPCQVDQVPPVHAS